MKARMVFLDRLKIMLTVLVVLHHTAIVYGGEGSWYYYENRSGDWASMLLSVFTVVNQSFFMGLFFFISGYVTPASYDRKGARAFLKDRLVRFGIPMLLYMLVMDPVLRYAASGYDGPFSAYAAEVWLAQPLAGIAGFRVGPLWFLLALLLFAGAYAAFRSLAGAGPGIRLPDAVTWKMLAGYGLAAGAGNFAIRLIFPVGTTVLSMQLGYFPAYILLFAGGIAAYRIGWLEKLNGAGSRQAGKVVAASMPVLLAALALGGDTSKFMGGWTWQSLLYSVLDPFLGIAIIYILLVRYRDRYHTAGRYTSWLSANAFTAYIVHALVVTYIAFWMRGVEAAPLLKFAVVGCLAAFLSFAAAALLRQLPVVLRIRNRPGVGERTDRRL